MKRKTVLGVMLAPLLTGSLGSLTNLAVAQQKTTTLNPVADATVWKDQPLLAIGGEGQLRVTNDPRFPTMVRNSYLKFDLKDIPLDSEILSAKLWLHLDDGGEPSKIGVHYSSNVTWEENKIYWNNAPSFEEHASYVNESVGFDDTWYYWIVTQDVQRTLANRMLTLVLVLNHTSHIEYRFDSREEYSNLRPRLEVTYNVPSVPPPETPDETTDKEIILLDMKYVVVAIVTILAITSAIVLFIIKKRMYTSPSEVPKPHNLLKTSRNCCSR